MKKLLFLSLLISSLSFADDKVTCDETTSIETDIVNYDKTILKNLKLPYYLYFEADKFEDLQTVKNCIDYIKCGKSVGESLVDDPKNYRMHIWDKFTKNELQEFIDTCPVPNLKQKLLIRETNNKGKDVSIDKSLLSIFYSDSTLISRSSPAIFKRLEKKESSEVVKKLTKLLAERKTSEANNLVIQTWQIDLHGYSIGYTGLQGSFATANHEKRKIEYSESWLNDPCDFIRMIRHEAEHVAQVKQAKRCGMDHDFNDHKKRERAAHLNDARFVTSFCPNTLKSESIRNYCVDRFKTNYSNLKLRNN